MVLVTHGLVCLLTSSWNTAWLVAGVWQPVEPVTLNGLGPCVGVGDLADLSAHVGLQMLQEPLASCLHCAAAWLHLLTCTVLLTVA